MTTIKNKKVIYFADPMLSMFTESIEEECDISVKSELDSLDIEFDNIICTDMPPFNESYDILFFDYGGMSMGNDMLGSFCRKIIKDAELFPSRYYVMVSTFTAYAMKDAIEYMGQTPKNIYLSVKQFAEEYKEIERLKDESERA